VGEAGVDCTKPGMTLPGLSVKPGFWRSGPMSKNIKQCYSAEACKGGNGTTVVAWDDSSARNSTNSSDPSSNDHKDTKTIFNDQSYYESIQTYEWSNHYCKEGYVGPYCQVCDIGFSGAFGGCRPCTLESDKSAKLTWTIVLLVFFVVLGFGFARIVSKFSAKTKKGLLIAGKLMLSTTQILIAMPSVFEVILPENFMKFLGMFNFLNFSFIDVFDIGCSFQAINIHYVMVTATLTPVFLCLPIFFMFLFNCLKDRNTVTVQAKEALRMNTWR